MFKGTFVDKLPSWSETSKDVNPPDAYLNANATGEQYVEIYSEVQALKSKYQKCIYYSFNKTFQSKHFLFVQENYLDLAILFLNQIDLN